MNIGPVGKTQMTAQDTKDEDVKPQISKTIRSSEKAANQSDSGALKVKTLKKKNSKRVAVRSISLIRSHFQFPLLKDGARFSLILL